MFLQPLKGCKSKDFTYYIKYLSKERANDLPFIDKDGTKVHLGSYKFKLLKSHTLILKSNVDQLLSCEQQTSCMT